VYYKKKPREGFFLRKNNKTTMLQYIKDVRGELNHVSWPTRTQTIIYTVVVIAVSLATALYLGFWDFIFSIIVRNII
jgi:preprotein translocase SecE subunit